MHVPARAEGTSSLVPKWIGTAVRPSAIGLPMKISLSPNDRVLCQAKRQAARNRITLTTFVEDALRAKPARPDSRTPRFRLRLEAVTGDAPPNVDIADRDALYGVIDRA